MTEWNLFPFSNFTIGKQRPMILVAKKTPSGVSWVVQMKDLYFLLPLHIVYNLQGLDSEREKLFRDVRPCFNENPRFIMVFLLGVSIFSLLTDGPCNERQRTEFVCKWCLSLEKMGERPVCQLLAAPPPAHHYLRAPSLLLNVRSILAAS